MSYEPTQSKPPSGGDGDGDGAGAHAGPNPNVLNMAASYQLIYVFVGVAGAGALYHLVIFCTKYLRRLTSMNNPSQKFFAKSNPFSIVKEHIIYAPLFKVRQNRNFQLGRLNMGTMPARLSTLLLLALVGVNAYLLARDLPIPLQAAKGSALYNRASTLALTNAIPLFMMAGRKNAFIRILGVSFNSFNTMHRWIGRLVISLIVIHGVTWTFSVAAKGGLKAVGSALSNTAYIQHGLGAGICFVVISLLAGPYLRKQFYETFLLTHQLLVAASLFLIYLHTRQFWQNTLVIVLASIWAGDRAVRFVNLIWNNVGRGGTRVTAEIVPGNAMRVTVRTPRAWNVRPGSHLYLYLPSVGLWQSHPFSIAWSEKQTSVVEEKGLVFNNDDLSADSTMGLVIRKRGGVTASLYKKAEKAGGRITLRAMVEGPYGGLHGLDSYGTVLLFAGGVGVTHQVPMIRHLISGFTDGSIACRKIVFVWAVQSSEHLEWVRPWMQTILAMEGRRDCAKMLIFVTRPDPGDPALNVQSPSNMVQMYAGRRPDVSSIIDTEMLDQVGAMAVSVCGSGAMSDDVRAEARKRQKMGNLDFFDEAFSW